MKYALCFPGQGAQQVGMGQELYRAFPSAKAVFDEADDALSAHLTKLSGVAHSRLNLKYFLAT